MADLAGAIRTGGGGFKKTELKIGYGAHRGYFLGLGDTFVEHSTFACRTCKGQRQIQGDDCRACSGSGKKSTTKVPILYQLGPDLIQEEFVTYAVTEPGKLQDGTPKSPSTLWVRIKALSGLTVPSEQSAWYANLPKPIKIPIEVMVVDSEAGNGLVIAAVRLFTPKKRTPEHEVGTFQDEPDFA